MYYHVHIPPPPLNAYIEDIFYYEAGIAPYEAEKLLPDNTIYLIINLTGEPKKLFTDQGLHTFTAYKKVWISGMQKNFIVIEATNNNCMLVVRFRPGGAHAFVKMPLQVIADTVIEGDDIMGAKMLSLREELFDIPLAADKCKRVELFLYETMQQHLTINPVINYMVQHLSAVNNTMTIKDLVAKTGYSHKHVIHLFEQYVGLSPKYFARIAKFRHVLDCVDKQQYFSWSSLANEYGFYDQAHFIHEFKNFSGINPSDYMLQKGEDFNYIPVNLTQAR